MAGMPVQPPGARLQRLGLVGEFFRRDLV